MRHLSHTNEKWLLDQSDEAWGFYICYKYATDRQAVKGIMTEQVKDLIAKAYKRDL